MNKKVDQTSRFLSLILRHQPESIGLKLNGEGWADIGELIRLANSRGTALSRKLIEEIVATSDKQRFALSDDGAMIRANQGHSVKIDLALAPQAPPPQLFHGTASHAIEAIRAQGLKPAARQHVHLSSAFETAIAVGKRHGRPVVLTVESGQMHADGNAFYLSANGVWLTDAVPVRYISFPQA
jgi:putative RNA 2'-phosphotransferase